MSKNGKIKISDIAKAAGVAPSTVSYALNGGRPISEETRAIIMQEVKRLGYRPNAIARSFSTKKTETIGFYTSKTIAKDDLCLLETIRGINSVLDQYGYKLLLLNEIESGSKLDADPIGGRTFPIDGAIVTSNRTSQRVLDDLTNDEIPYVLLGKSPKGLEALHMDCDVHTMTYQLLEMFFKSGADRVALAIDSGRSQSVSMSYMSGYIQAYSDYMKEYDDSLILRVSPGDPNGVSTLADQLHRQQADAVLLTNLTNPAFRGFLVTRRRDELGLQVACFGYDLYRSLYEGLPLAPFIDVPSNAFALGEACASAVMTLIQDPDKSEILQSRLFRPEPVFYYSESELYGELNA